MNFKQYYLNLSPDGKRELAKQLKTSVPYLSQLAYGRRKAGSTFVLEMPAATGFIVSPLGVLNKEPDTS